MGPVVENRSKPANSFGAMEYDGVDQNTSRANVLRYTHKSAAVRDSSEFFLVLED